MFDERLSFANICNVAMKRTSEISYKLFIWLNVVQNLFSLLIQFAYLCLPCTQNNPESPYEAHWWV